MPMTPRNRPDAYDQRVAIARLVGQHWVDAILSNSPDLSVPWRAAAHPLGCVRAALDGENDPAQLGIEEGETAERIRRIADGQSELGDCLTCGGTFDTEGKHDYCGWCREEGSDAG